MRAMVLAAVVGLSGCAPGTDASGPPAVPRVTWPTPASMDTPAPTTDPPPPPTAPTSAEPIDEDEAVVAAFDGSRLAYVDCLVDPAMCPYDVVALAGSEADAEMRERVDVVVTGNLRVLPDSGPYTRIIESVAVDGDAASVQSCLTDGLVVVDVVDAANPADDIIFDDSTSSYRVRWTFVRTAEGWRRTTSETLASFPGTTSCDG